MKELIKKLKNVTILYVEDEIEIRDIFTKTLESFCKNIIVAEDGNQAFEKFKKNKHDIDIIITDLNMPGMNGIELIKKIKKINYNIPIIITTAFSEKDYLMNSINLGVDRYVLKPILMPKLIKTITELLKYYNVKRLYRSHLMDLPNRSKLKKDLLTIDIDKNINFALIDIDDFSKINDLFGEKVGDEVLIYLGKQIINKFSGCKKYSLGKDLFAIIGHKDLTKEDFFNKCNDFLKKIEESVFSMKKNNIDLNLTIGVVCSSPDKVVKYSERIKNYARTKKEKIMLYDKKIGFSDIYKNNLEWIKRIKVGFKNNSFVAYYQPIVSTKTNQILKFEALIRYVDPITKKVYLPKCFLEIAKTTKLYPLIVRVMLKKALEFIKIKQKIVSVNISYDDLANKQTLRHIYSILEKEKNYTKYLEFEVLESDKINSFCEINDFVKKIKKYNINIKFGIDDFGRGYSNFDIVTRLNIDFVKIDGLLIESTLKSENNVKIVKAIAEFFKKLGIKTIAEFVANEEIYNKIKETSVDYCQGYYFGEPVSIDKIK